MKTYFIQNRKITTNEIKIIKELIKNNPTWHRTRLSREICKLWNWKNHNGILKDMACRNMLLKLEKLNELQLPEKQNKNYNHLRNKSIPYIKHSKVTINTKITNLFPIKINIISSKNENNLFRTFINNYHYLGYCRYAGENMKYIAYDNQNNPLACFLFAAAAWSVKDRDTFIGWKKEKQKSNLCYITNNQRFLILPWIQVKYLASYLLARVTNRIKNDWIEKYGHPIFALETFVEKNRFNGTCYKVRKLVIIRANQGTFPK
jgi:hypothetical protein